MNRPLDPTLFCLTVLPLLLGAVTVAFLILPEVPLLARYVVVLPLAYLLGSIPWGYIFLQWYRGVDIRDYGSGKTGMTNVLRTAGGGVAAAVLLLDLSKGVLVVLLAREVLNLTSAEVIAGLLALAGHNWPVFLKFRGGRGIATGLGILSVMAPLPALIGAMVFLPITLVSRYLSLGSIIGVMAASASLLALALLGMYSTAYTWYAVVGGALIIWQHRDNIQRLLQGTERRLGTPATRIE